MNETLNADQLSNLRDRLLLSVYVTLAMVARISHAVHVALFCRGCERPSIRMHWMYFHIFEVILGSAALPAVRRIFFCFK